MLAAEAPSKLRGDLRENIFVHRRDDRLIERSVTVRPDYVEVEPAIADMPEIMHAQAGPARFDLGECLGTKVHHVAPAKRDVASDHLSRRAQRLGDRMTDRPQRVAPVDRNIEDGRVRTLQRMPIFAVVILISAAYSDILTRSGLSKTRKADF